MRQTKGEVGGEGTWERRKRKGTKEDKSRCKRQEKESEKEERWRNGECGGELERRINRNGAWCHEKKEWRGYIQMNREK